MKVLTTIFVFLAFIYLPMQDVFANENTAKAEYEAFFADLLKIEKSIPKEKVDTWGDFYKFYKKNKHLDDGAFAAGISDVTAKILSKSWNKLDGLAKYAEKDPQFRGFVLKHIDASANPADIKEIIDLANKSCPTNQKKLCKSIFVSATKAYTE